MKAAAGVVVRPAATTAVTVPAQGAGLIPVALAPFDTTGLPLGEYTLEVTVADAAGNPFAASVPGTGRVRGGTPVTAGLTSTPETFPTGPGTRAAHTLTLTADVPLAPPFTLVGQATATPTSNSVAVVGTAAYVAGTEGVDVVDVSNPAAPVIVGTIADTLIVRGGFTVVRALPGNRLAIASTVTLNALETKFLIYDLTDPLNPSLVSNTCGCRGRRPSCPRSATSSSA